MKSQNKIIIHYYNTMDKVSELFANYRNQIYIAGLAFVIIVVLYLIYRQKPIYFQPIFVQAQPQVQQPQPQAGQDVPQEQETGELDGGGQEPVKVILFFAPWCSHCKHLMAGPDSTWEKLKQKLGHKVKFEEVNCDEKPDMATQFGVKGFPTILKFKKDKIDEFGGERSLESLEGFVNSD